MSLKETMSKTLPLAGKHVVGSQGVVLVPEDNTEEVTVDTVWSMYNAAVKQIAALNKVVIDWEQELGKL